jgi:superfamily II DNA or RNA helicase
MEENMATQIKEKTIEIEEVLDTMPLWESQRAAISRMREYILAYQRGKTKKSALVHMPTGGGKTGVIAILSRCAPEVNSALVLTPRVALRAQLYTNIQDRFFQSVAPTLDTDAIPKQVIEVADANAIQRIPEQGTAVIIMSIQMVDRMNRIKDNFWTKWVEKISLVIIDEGHCEPATSWSQAIRSFRTPKIIFTATPFRNDLKFFTIDPAFIFSYTLHNALQDHILREVEFVPMKADKDPNKFGKSLLTFYDDTFNQFKEPKPRVIIRCENRENIRQIETVLEREGRDFLAIHETFTEETRKPYERKDVPTMGPDGKYDDPLAEKAVFWIHQFKLQEGIDDPRFRILASFEPQKDGRALVQQIGRIIRNPDRDPLAKGYVLDYSHGQQQDLWNSFLEYDRAITENGPRAFNLASDSGWLRDLFKSQPILTYLKYRFRTPLDLRHINIRTDINFPRIVNIRYVEQEFRLAKFCEQLEQGFRDEDRFFQKYNEKGAVIYLYITFDNSPLLENAYFIEPELGITYLREIKVGERGWNGTANLLTYYDSSRNLTVDFDATHVGKPVGSYYMKKLFTNDTRSCLTSVSLKNSNLGTIAIRARSISAARIEETVSAFDDHAQICTNATGYSLEEDKEAGNQRLRRYLGFQHGRISESGSRCQLIDFEQWLSGIVATLDQPRNPYPTFQRYALERVDIFEGTPKHILLDIREVQDSFETIGSKDVPGGLALEIEDVSHEIKRGHFYVRANGKRCAVKIEADPERRRFILSSADLDGLFCRKADQTDKRGLITYLNQEQSFRLITEAEDLIYTLGEFYRPAFKVGKAFNPASFEVSQILIPVPILEQIGKEKGEPVTTQGWPEDTLFGIIDSLGLPARGMNPALFECVDRAGRKISLWEHFGDPDIVVCDDMGTESADFILADTRNLRVVFIHAKANSQNRPASASALQEVVGQATKNINFLGMFNQSRPDNLNRWKEPWKGKAGLPVDKRIRRGPPNSVDAWEKIHAVIRHPLADREVWLFLGRTLSRRAFENLLQKSPPGAEAFQAALLLHATLCNVASVGAKLSVFCYP